MLQDYYLKFNNKQECDIALSTIINDSISIDILGDLSTSLVIDEDGLELQKAVTIAGWHVNIRSPIELPEILIPYVLPKPNNPRRSWI